jgi:hypothetical protein
LFESQATIWGRIKHLWVRLATTKELSQHFGFDFICRHFESAIARTLIELPIVMAADGWSISFTAAQVLVVASKASVSFFLTHDLPNESNQDGTRPPVCVASEQGSDHQMEAGLGAVSRAGLEKRLPNFGT